MKPPRKKPGRKILAADLFCGAGGFSTGLMRALEEQTDCEVVLTCVNHWPVAIETHTLNHPFARHVCADLEAARPEELVPEGKLDILLASPTCTYHSRARGGRPTSDQQRMDPWIIVKWCTILRVKRLVIENVPEFVEWGPIDTRTGRPIKSRRGEYFRAWWGALEAIGGRGEHRVLKAADYGDATTRERFFALFRFDGGKISWPMPTHAPADRAMMLGLQSWRSAREIIDWSLKGRSIFDRPNPLAENTIRRVVTGAMKFRWSEPYMVALRNHCAARSIEMPVNSISAGGTHLGLAQPSVRPFVLSQASGGAARDAGEPLPTFVGRAGSQLAEPVLVAVTGAGKPKAPRSPGEPLGTITGKNGVGIAEPCLITVAHGNSAREKTPDYRRAHDIGSPVPSITAAAIQVGVAEPFVTPYYGGGSGLTGSSVEKPLDAVTTKARFGLVEPVVIQTDQTGWKGSVRSAGEPLHTIVTKQNAALVQAVAVEMDEAAFARALAQDRVVEIDGVPHVIDILFRMLKNHELAAAMSFSDAEQRYEFAGTQEQVTRQIGNAVPVRTAKALICAIMGVPVDDAGQAGDVVEMAA